MYGWQYSNLTAQFISGATIPTNCTEADPWTGVTDKPDDKDPGDIGGGGGTGEEPDIPSI
jgi:hypothetical protein